MARPIRVLIALAALLGAGRTAAQVTTDAGTSVLFFPLVAADGERDTVIQLANRSTNVTFVRCAYTAGEGGGAAALEFHLKLLALQPTHWAASSGRAVDGSDMPCTRDDTDCDGAGSDPGVIPALPEGFRGDLVCVQLDRSGAPRSGNALRGSAMLIGADGDTARYEAIGVPGVPANDADGTLCLGGEPGEGCPRGAEYAACPESWLLGLRAEGVAQGAAAEPPTVHSSLVIATCARRSGSGGAVVQISVTSEFEQRLTASISVQRWRELVLADETIFDREVIGTDFIQTRLRSVGPGIAVVGLSRRVSSTGEPAGGAVATIPHSEGARASTDRIVLVDE